MTIAKLHDAPVAEITAADIMALIKDEAEEGLRLELKRELSAADRQQDPWMMGGKKVADRARDALAKEVVALANAYGGVILVGIDETDEHPKRARGPDPYPIPRVIECAERLAESLQAVIDPPLRMLEVKGVVLSDDGAGVLFIRTAASPMGPHGHGRPPLAFMRRGSRSEPMTMRDLHSAYFETRSRSEVIEAKRNRRRGEFMKLRERRIRALPLRSPDKNYEIVQRDVAIGFRCSLIPAENLGLRIVDAPNAHHLQRPDRSIVEPQAAPALGEGHFPSSWAPRAGGCIATDWDAGQLAFWYLGDDGTVDAQGYQVARAHSRDPHNRPNAFVPSWFVVVVAQCMALAEQLRRRAKRSDIEYILDCQIVVDRFTEDTMSFMAIDGEGFGGGRAATIPEGIFDIGPFSIGGPETMQTVFTEAERGIWHALGLICRKPLTLRLVEWMTHHPSL